MQRRKGGVYYFRRAVPEDLRELLGKREIVVSLKTTDPDRAKRLVSVERLKTDKLLAEARRMLANPAAVAYRTAQLDAEDRRNRPRTDEELEAEDLALSDALEQATNPARVQSLHAVIESRRNEEAGKDNPPLSIVFERWRSEREPPSKTWEEWNLARKRLEAVLGGDWPVRGIKRQHVLDFKNSLLKTPSQRGGGNGTLSLASVQKNLNAVSSVLSWAVGQGYLDANPVVGVSLAGIKRAQTKSRKLPYESDDLKKIFAIARRLGPDYWLPALALYTGARLEELGQLLVNDVREADGIAYLDITLAGSENKRLKNEGSQRRIPIHSELVRLGFLAYVKAQRQQGHTRLFPTLKADRHGSLTSIWSKWWGRHARKAAGITDPRKTFHSFRHGFVDACRSVMSEEHRHALTGHSGGGVGRSYGTTVPLKVLAKAIAKVRYAGVKV